MKSEILKNLAARASAMLLLLALTAAPACAKEKVQWLVYLYLVGSDLESASTRNFDPDSGGMASADFAEVIEGLEGINPGNVRVLVQTGGAKKWMNEVVSNKHIEIYEVGGDDVTPLKQYPNQSMGREDTLARFLKFGEERYDAAHRMIIFWDHGSGPTGGVGYDENFNDDSLSLAEIASGFAKVFQKTEKPFEIVGFDACLMGSLPTAYHMSRWGHVLIASEQLEPGLGWHYTPWLKALGKNPRMSLRDLSARIISSYARACDDEDEGDAITLSAISLDAFPELMEALLSFSVDVLDRVLDNNSLFNQLDRIAARTEYYGNRDKSRGEFSDVLDLGLLVEQLGSWSPKEAAEVKAALKKTVIHNHTGKVLHGRGISMYYPIGKQVGNYREAMKNDVMTAFDILYGIQLNVINDKNYEQYYRKLVKTAETTSEHLESCSRYSGYIDSYSVAGSGSASGQEPKPDQSPTVAVTAPAAGVFSQMYANVSQMQASQKTDFGRLEDLPISFDKDNNSFVKVPKELLDSISTVELEMLLYVMPNDELKKGMIINLGSDVQLQSDWEKGVFTDSFSGAWPAMDGHLLAVTVTNISDDFITYDSAIKVNGEPHNMVLAYNNETRKYSILGVQRINENGVPDRISIRLKNGDRIAAVFDGDSILDDSEKEDNSFTFEDDEFVYTSKSKIEDMELGESNVAFVFTFRDAMGNEASSQVVAVEIDEKNNLTIQTFDDVVKEYMEGQSGGASDDESDDSDSNEEEDDDDENDDEKPVTSFSSIAS
ncbi:MAG: hypothetical protein IJ523_03415 [Succinivibrionaceae bacterium]|nr:hypothetical protein [Succinivibrionaceae bacterium]